MPHCTARCLVPTVFNSGKKNSTLVITLEVARKVEEKIQLEVLS